MGVKPLDFNCADCGETLTACFSGELWDQVECHKCFGVNTVSFEVYVEGAVVGSDGDDHEDE